MTASGCKFSCPYFLDTQLQPIFHSFFLMFLWLNSGKWSISTCCVPLLSKRPSPTHAHKIIKNFHVVIYPFFPGNLSGPNTQDHLGNNVEMASPCQLKLLSGQAPVNVNTHWIRPYLNEKKTYYANSLSFGGLSVSTNSIILLTE